MKKFILGTMIAALTLPILAMPAVAANDKEEIIFRNCEQIKGFGVKTATASAYWMDKCTPRGWTL